MQLKPRPTYLSKLIDLKDTEFIKVIVGMRRTGKSSLLMLFADYLAKHKVAKSRIIFMNFESAEYLRITSYEQLLEELSSKLENASPQKKCYLLFDEIQLVDQWEKALNALRLRDDVDIYMTGSNAFIFSGQLATLLSGRYVEINVYPLSFKEFASFSNAAASNEGLLERYVTYGGLPPVVEQGENRDLANMVLSGIYNTVFVKDIAQHVQVRNSVVFSDIAAFLADTAGSSVSISKIENRLKSAHRKTASETIERYIGALIDSFLFYRARRFDLKGSSVLQGLEKYYPSDLGIRNMLLGFPKRDYGYILENIVHNELVVRGFEVRVGKLDNLEIDFVAPKTDKTLLVQVCASMLDEKTRSREMAVFKKINKSEWESAEKMIITYDKVGLGQENGVEIVNVIDWLMSEPS